MPTSKDPDSEGRRWLHTRSFDLITWEDESGLSSFQLSYDKRRDERLLEWRRVENELWHFRVGGSDEVTGPPRSPTLSPESRPIPDDLVARLESELGDRVSRPFIADVVRILRRNDGS